MLKSCLKHQAFTYASHFTFLQLSFSRVTQVANLGGGRQVIRVKNCSGQKTVMWSGAWNPDDTRWANLPPGIQRELDAETFHDGGFWMAYGDFLKYFEVSIYTLTILPLFLLLIYRCNEM